MVDILHLTFLIFVGTHIFGQPSNITGEHNHVKYYIGNTEEGQVLIEMAEGKDEKVLTEMAEEEEEQVMNEKAEEEIEQVLNEMDGEDYNKPQEEFLDLSGFKEGCGTRARRARKPRIIGGKVTPPHSFPWIVRIHG